MPHAPLAPSAADRPQRVLEPDERIAEVLFGLIMVLTFTGSLSVAESERNDVRVMLIGALGCNIAWGIIDGLLYVMGRLGERGRGIRGLGAVRSAGTPEEAHRTIADALPPLIAATLGSGEYETIRQRLNQLPEPAIRPGVSLQDLKGALAVFLWVFVTTLPVAVPFIFVHDVSKAMRASNTVAVVMLFLTGFAFGRVTGHRAWLMGAAMVAVGIALVTMTMALGG